MATADGAPFRVVEICAGGGGQSLGLERAGFAHAAAIEIDKHACATLRRNRPGWTVLEGDVRNFDGRAYNGIDLLAGGVPCPPYSVAGKQLGSADERDLFPEALRLVREAEPTAVMLENVRGFASAKFADYRAQLVKELNCLGYSVDWRVLNASDFGVPQLRPRFVLVAVRHRYANAFVWPEPQQATPSVGDAIGDLLASRSWPGAAAWMEKARSIAPTITGGSLKHGGPDLGPTRARAQWRLLGVDGMGLADEPPGPEKPVDYLPRLTTRMVARLQGFPDDWSFAGGKTAIHRQVGNAFPPPVAEAVGRAIGAALTGQNKPRLQPRLLELVG